MKKFKSEHSRKVLKTLGNIIAFGSFMILAPRFSGDERYENNRESVAYYDAVRAIMNTSMFADDKRKAVAAMKHTGSTEYYKTVISIIQTSMFADDKIAMIKALD